MSSKNALRGRKGRQASRSCLRLESLEPRLALATIPAGGNVTAQLVGSTLLLTGDALDNALVVSTATGGRMAVIGAPGTTINGASTAVTPFVTSRAVTSIIANLGGGNDQIGFGNSAAGFARQLGSVNFTPTFTPSTLEDAIDKVAALGTTFSLPGSLTVTMAAGDDAVGLIGNVGGSVAVNLGSASKRNGFVVGDPSGNAAVNRVGGGVAVVGGAQEDRVSLFGTTVVDGVSAALGDGVNLFGVLGYGASVGSLAYTGGKGNDLVGLQQDLAVRHGVSIFTGPQGEDVVDLFLSVTVGGSVVVNTGIGADDDFVLARSDIRGGLSVTTGAGDDTVRVNTGSIGGDLTVTSGAGDDSIAVALGSIGGGLAINSGEGNDEVNCSLVTVALNTVIDAGAGNDYVFSDGLTTRYNLFVYLGSGNDQLELYNARAFAAFLYGGPGTNSLKTDPATRTGIRTLRYFQFQMVTTVA